jgi:hypothetical protein
MMLVHLSLSRLKPHSTNRLIQLRYVLLLREVGHQQQERRGDKGSCHHHITRSSTSTAVKKNSLSVMGLQ